MNILIEVLIVFCFAIAIWHEDKIIKFEDELFSRPRKHYIERLRRDLH